MNEHDLMQQDLATMIVVLGSYLYAGGSIDEVDYIVLDRLAELIDNKLTGIPENVSIH
jgi:hypothetical protein|tara:strand:+ start:1095 stop:1268 length:174 start_codon:yes stop_codon:yes gene_type:complete